MGRVIQKKKNRSSLPKVHHKPKSKRINIRSNPIVAANWSSSQTLAQNYARLGLTSRLNARAGGTEPPLSSLLSTVTKIPPYTDSLSITSQPASAARGGSRTLIPGTARIIRDPITRAITKVVHDPSSSSAQSELGAMEEKKKKKKNNPLNDPLNMFDDSDDDGEMRDLGVGKEKAGIGSGGSIVRQLEAAAQAGDGGRKRPRMQSRREEEWIERLVGRWGEDYDAMVRDRRLNPWQQSAGDLKKRVKRWKDGGGGGMVVGI
ncbi:Nucleolar protein 16 [Pseudocyphellaria aurata]|nr:Nucleolar protein 16 [Pseudocyphellaria aurata]